MAEIRSAFGRAVRIARTRKGWSQEGLAHHAGLNRNYVSDIERGVRNPTLEVQEKIAAALGLSLGELMTAADSEREQQRRSAERRGKP